MMLYWGIYVFLYSLASSKIQFNKKSCALVIINAIVSRYILHSSIEVVPIGPTTLR